MIGITSVSITFPQTAQLLVLNPSDTSVASLTTTQSPRTWLLFAGKVYVSEVYPHSGQKS